MNTAKRPEDLVKGVVKLVSLPEVFIGVNRAMDDPKHAAKQLSDIISHDPALTARILRIVNSSYYGLAVKIELVSRAVSVIGEQDLRNLVLATSAVDVFKRMPNELVDVDLFWRHSIHTGIVARLLSRYCNILHGERLFVAGLLHDIGKLVLYHKEMVLSQQVMLKASAGDGVVFRAEEEIIGFSHADVGGALITSWQLADTLREVVTYHHHPLLAKKYPIETSLVHIADCVVNSIGIDTKIDKHLLDDKPGFEPEALRITGIDLSVLPEVMDKAWEQAGEVLDIICPRF